MLIKVEDRIILEVNNKKYCRTYRASDVFEKKGKKVAFAEDIDMELAIFRINNKLHCFSNICPHRHQPDIHNSILSDNKLSCPQHGWTYFIETGKNINQKQGIKDLKKYDIFEQDGWIYVEIPPMEIPKWREVPLSR